MNQIISESNREFSINGKQFPNLMNQIISESNRDFSYSNCEEY